MGDAIREFYEIPGADKAWETCFKEYQDQTDALWVAKILGVCRSLLWTKRKRRGTRVR